MKATSDTRRLNTVLCITGLVLLCINPVWTEGKDSINLLLCAVMCVSPLVLLIRDARTVIPRIDIPLGLVCLSVITMPLVFHPETVRWSTMLFTCAYCVFFMMLAKLVKLSDIGCRLYLKTIRCIVYAFTVTLLLQQACVLLGLPLILKSQIYYPVLPWKLNSLTAEPSHTTVILCTLMYFYTQSLRETRPEETLWQEIVNEKWLWLGFTWTIFSTYNASAFILGPLCLLPYINRRNVIPVTGVAVIAAILLFATPLGNFTLTGRLKGAIAATLSLDEEKIIEADPSASARIVPTIRGTKAIRPSDPQTYYGYGVDADRTDIAPRPCDLNERGFAGIFSMWHNYGAVCAIFFWTAIFMVTAIKKKWLTAVTFVFALQMSAEYNMQLIWQLMAFSMVYKYSVCKNHRLLANVNIRQ